MLYCLLEFKPHSLKNLKLFLLRVKIFEPIFFFGKTTGFESLKPSISNVNGFYDKNTTFWNGSLFLTKNRLSRNEM